MHINIQQINSSPNESTNNEGDHEELDDAHILKQ